MSAGGTVAKTVKKPSLIGLYLLAAATVIASFVYLAVGKTTTIGSQSYRLEEVSLTADLAKGLSGRASLDDDRGMLFVFDKPARHGIWMKDMQFDIDIIWLDDQGKVIYLVDNASPDEYPTIYTPNTPASHVIELNDKALESNGLQLGDTIKL